jgi:CheY-like chemotaxis protein
MPRVLVIDDEPDTVLTLLDLLRMEGFDATGFASAREALRNIRELDPDAVICDLSMPVLTGWDFAREVRHIMGYSRPLLVGISGQYKRPPDEMLARVAGFNHYVLKPWDPNELLRLLAKFK